MDDGYKNDIRTGSHGWVQEGDPIFNKWWTTWGARRQICPHVWRVLGTIPVVLVGDAAEVRALEFELQDKAPEKMRQSVDLWVRVAATQPGSRYKLMKKSIVLMYGHGDIERLRVCPAVLRHRSTGMA